ncbi:MAG: terminase small subunit [Rhodanobacteraceae bacterium]
MADTPEAKRRSRHAKGDGGTLTHKQAAFLHHFASGMTAKDAAIAAGYSKDRARSHAYDLVRHPQIRAELDKIAEKAREETAYTIAEAFREAGEAIEHAKEKGNPNAHVRAVELRARLHGLLVDKLEVKAEPVDIAGALAAARARVLPPLEIERESSELAEGRARLRLPRDNAEPIEAECTVIPGASAARATDYQSAAPQMGPPILPEGEWRPGVGAGLRRDVPSRSHVEGAGENFFHEAK